MEPTHSSATAAPGPRMPRLLGGRLCLDFANTVDPRHGPRRREYLNSYADLVAWGIHAGAVTADEAARLGEGAVARPGAAQAVFGRAIDLREALYRLFLAVAAGQAAAPADLNALNQAYGAAMVRAGGPPRPGLRVGMGDGRTASRPASMRGKAVPERARITGSRSDRSSSLRGGGG